MVQFLLPNPGSGKQQLAGGFPAHGAGGDRSRIRSSSRGALVLIIVIIITITIMVYIRMPWPWGALGSVPPLSDLPTGLAAFLADWAAPPPRPLTPLTLLDSRMTRLTPWPQILAPGASRVLGQAFPGSEAAWCTQLVLSHGPRPRARQMHEEPAAAAASQQAGPD